MGALSCPCLALDWVEANHDGIFVVVVLCTPLPPRVQPVSMQLRLVEWEEVGMGGWVSHYGQVDGRIRGVLGQPWLGLVWL